MKKKDWAFVFVSDSVRKTEKKIHSYNKSAKRCGGANRALRKDP